MHYLYHLYHGTSGVWYLVGVYVVVWGSIPCWCCGYLPTMVLHKGSKGATRGYGCIGTVYSIPYIGVHYH